MLQVRRWGCARLGVAFDGPRQDSPVASWQVTGLSHRREALTPLTRKKCRAHPRYKGVTFQAAVALPWTQWWRPMARVECLHTSKTRSYFMLKASYLRQDHSRQPIKPCQFARLTPQHDPAAPPCLAGPSPPFPTPPLFVQSTIHVPSGTAAVTAASTQEGNTVIRR